MNVISKKIVGFVLIAMLVLPGVFVSYNISQDAECGSDDAKPNFILPYILWTD